MANQLKNMKINMVALVDRAANKRTFYLKKQEQGEPMLTKDLAIKLIGSYECTPEEAKQIIEAVSEADRPEVQAAYDAKGAQAPNETEMIAQACADKMVKAGAADLKTINDSIDALKKLVEEHFASMKALEAAPAAVAQSADGAPVAKNDNEISPEQLQKMLDERLLKEGL